MSNMQKPPRSLRGGLRKMPMPDDPTKRLRDITRKLKESKNCRFSIGVALIQLRELSDAFRVVGNNKVEIELRGIAHRIGDAEKAMCQLWEDPLEREAALLESDLEMAESNRPRLNE